ncbi:hypothetical protein F4779DRAFT_617674 [Xylariaceae sp. FL0662B]|nr:hypothetical protein F4779DRAFT_617674 [Xylariaceae sp. FL0662B]
MATTHKIHSTRKAKSLSTDTQITRAPYRPTPPSRFTNKEREVSKNSEAPIMVQLAARTFILSSHERQQEVSDQYGELRAISRPQYSFLGGPKKFTDSAMRNVLYAFALVFSFRRDGRDVTAAIAGEYFKGNTRTLEVRIAKNEGVNFEFFNGLFLKGVMQDWFKTGGSRTTEDSDLRQLILYLCFERIKAYVVEHKRKWFSPGLQYLRRWKREGDKHEKTAATLSFLLGAIESLHLSNREQLHNILRESWEFIRDEQISFLKLCDELDRRTAQGGDRHSRNAIKCANLIEKLSRLPRAFADLCEFKKYLKSCKVSLKIHLVPCSPSRQPPEDMINDEITELRTDHLLPKLKEMTFEHKGKSLRPHCEVQLLADFEKLPEARQLKFWKFVGCSKRSCFCCSYVIEAAGFQAERSHGKIYHPWPLPEIPEGIPKNSGLPRGLEKLLVTFNKRLDNATTKKRFDARPGFPESPSRLFHDWTPEWETMGTINETGET